MELKTLLMLALVAMVTASDVIELKDSDFESGIAEFGIALVKFYAPW